MVTESAVLGMRRSATSAPTFGPSISAPEAPAEPCIADTPSNVHHAPPPHVVAGLVEATHAVDATAPTPPHTAMAPDGCVVWFTSLVGRHTTVPTVVAAARAAGALTVRVRTLAQGRTWRWVLAWSFLPPSAFLRQGWGFQYWTTADSRAHSTIPSSGGSREARGDGSVVVGIKRPRPADAGDDDAGSAALTTPGLVRVVHCRAMGHASADEGTLASNGPAAQPSVAVGCRRLQLHVPASCLLSGGVPPPASLTAAAAEYPIEQQRLSLAGLTAGDSPRITTLIDRLNAAIATSPAAVDRDSKLRLVRRDGPSLLPADRGAHWALSAVLEYWRDGPALSSVHPPPSGLPYLDMAVQVGLLVRADGAGEAGGASDDDSGRCTASAIVVLLRSDDPDHVVAPVGASSDDGSGWEDTVACEADVTQPRDPAHARTLPARWCRLVDHLHGSVMATGKRYRRAAMAAAATAVGGE